ncbi:ABC transporter permease subunit [Sulfurovum sp. XGS-02]|uniref:ABC transporter permease n=1 Tax=Sulfurovum sp. XGS-02 TaxID=2925411 RepID=UPI00205F70CA|nr:ABC transporter permease subunit [Sulfurovum sp. XGS-02]UPT78592.1 ABC transporter permease subunit [Sulfurovum sp. XGS-02]
MKYERMKQIIFPLFVLIAILGIWSGIASMVDEFPTSADTYVAAFGGEDAEGDKVDGIFAEPFYIDDEEDKGIFWHLLESLKSVFGGFALSLIIGIPLGIHIGMSKNLQYAFDPFIQIIKPISPFAWLPLLFFIFKDIKMTVISTIFLTSVWPIMIKTVSGVHSVSEDYMNVAKILRFTALEKVVQIILPVAVPYIFSGMRLSLGLSWIVIIGAEMLTGGIGIGVWIWDAYDNLEYAHVIIGMILVGLIGFTLDLMMRRIADFFDYTKKGRAS